jgi:hypothetical protein
VGNLSLYSNTGRAADGINNSAFIAGGLELDDLEIR